MSAGTSAGGTAGNVTIEAFVGLLWRRRVTVFLTVLLCTALATVVTVVRAPGYTAQAVVNVTPVTANPLGGSSTKDVSTITEVKVVTSTSVAQLAAADLRWPKDTSALLEHVAATSPLDSQVIVVTFSASSAGAAAAGANAFANAYLEYRSAGVEGQLQRSSDKLDKRIRDLQQAEAQAGSRYSASPAGSSARNAADARRRDLQSQVAALMSQQNALLTANISPGEVVSPASVPSSASLKQRLVLPLGGLVLGMVLAAAAAVLRDRRDDRVFGADDAAAVLGTTVLATIAGPRGGKGPGRGAEVLQSLSDPNGSAAESYRVLAAKLLAPVTGRGARTLLVTGVPGTTGAYGSTVALELAATLAGQSVAVAYVATSDAMEAAAALLGTAEPPLERLLLVPVDSEAPTRTRSQEILRGASDRADVVVIDALTSGRASTALSLGQAADAALMVVEERRTGAAGLAHWAEELAQVGLTVLGAVLVRAKGKPVPSRGRALAPRHRVSTASVPFQPTGRVGQEAVSAMRGDSA